MSAHLTEEQLMAKLEELRAKNRKKEDERKAGLASKITTKEALIVKIEGDFETQVAKLATVKDERIAKLNAEILVLNEEIGLQPGPITDATA